MPATDLIGRNRRDQVHAMDAHHELSAAAQDQALDSFQRRVADLLSPLASGEILSLPWIDKLLGSFLMIQEEFRSLVESHRAASRPPLDRLLSDYSDRAVKALDVCNAIRDGVEQIRQWRAHLEIAVAALNPSQKAIGEGQIRRARKALTDLTVSMLDDRDASAVNNNSHRNRSFSRCKEPHRSIGVHFRSLSWSMSRSWSAARQLQAIGAGLAAPRGAEVAATAGIAVPVYTMGSVLLFVMWALVAAIPCQDRGLQTHISAPRSLPWSLAVLSMHERILEESKRRERRNASGLLKEIQSVERVARRVMELTEGGQWPAKGDERKEGEIKEAVGEMKELCDSLKDGLDTLERQVREVFHRIMRSRTEGLDCSSHNRE